MNVIKTNWSPNNMFKGISKIGVIFRNNICILSIPCFKSIINHCSFYSNSTFAILSKTEGHNFEYHVHEWIIKTYSSTYILKHQMKLKLLRKCIYYSDVPQLIYIKNTEISSSIGQQKSTSC